MDSPEGALRGYEFPFKEAPILKIRVELLSWFMSASRYLRHRY